MRSGLSLTGAILAGILILAPAGSPAQETSAPGADPALEQAIHDYILAHPEVIAESLLKFQQQQEDAQKQAHAQAVKDLKPQLVSNSASPVLGNPAGDITVVEFLDYRCPYCKAMHQSIADMIAADGNVRVVVKEFPILGDDSIFAARAALAAGKQGKYAEMHTALMTFKGKLSAHDVENIAVGLALDVTKLKEDMQTPEVNQELQQNYSLAESLGINGTPAFIIGETLIPGAIKLEDLKAHIAKARAEPS
jgi:protein-disulfide isomerase